jgi:hypothetical protein
MVAAVDLACRLRVPVEDATRACWCVAHGVTSLLIAGYFAPDDPAVALLRDGVLAELIKTAPARPTRRGRSQKGSPA